MKLLRNLLTFPFFILLFVIALPLIEAWRTAFAYDNQPPVANNDSYTRHGPGTIGPVLLNDFDPDANYPLTAVLVTTPSQGNLSGLDGNSFSYTPNQPSFVGTDSFTYRACDTLGACSNSATVTINVVNEAPVALGESFVAHGPINFGPMMANDFDPDMGDQLFYTQVNGASHGTVFGLPNPPFPSDIQNYQPNPGYTGVDSFEYKVCDQFFACSNTVKVTFYVIQAGGENNGVPDCNSIVGEPINVTNGNMYLQQVDHVLPGAGHMIHLERTYNSKSTQLGLFGRGWSTAYDESLTIFDSSIVRLNTPDGRAIYFGRPTGSSGAFLSLVGDFHGQITQTAGGYNLWLKDGTVHQFNSNGRLNSLTDRNGNQTNLAYNLSGKLSSVIDPFGRLLSFFLNINGRVLSIADTTGILADYTYGTNSELLSVTYQDNSGYTFTYDSSLRLAAARDKLNNLLESHTYDSQGRAITSQRDGGVENYTLNYFSTTETHVTDALGRVTKYFFDTSQGRNVVTRIEGVCGCGGGGSQVLTWTYDNNLNVTQTTDGLGHPTNYTYDSGGNVLTVSDATGTITSTYNSFGQVLTRTDQMFGVTTNTYSPTGNLLTSKDALNNTTTFTYDSRGQLLTLTDARNKTTTFTWDTSGRLTELRDALNNTTDVVYDARARVTIVTNALTHTTSYEYDAAGRLKKVIYPDTNFVEFTYDLAGRRTKVRDPRGHETSFGYDGAYRLTDVTDALNHTTSYGYDLMSNLTSTTDALLRVTDFEYDEFNRLKKIVYPPAFTGSSRLQESITYDAAGNVTKRTDTAARDTTYLYDSANRLTRITDPALQATQFEYNARSQRTAVVDALNQQYSFVSDPLGRITQSTRAGTSMNYTYDAVGNVTQRTDYNGAITTYVHDDLNRLSTINYPDSTTASYGYDELSRLTSAVNQNGAVTFIYDSRDRLTSTTDVWGQTVGYSHDENGNRTALTLGGSSYASYQYDDVDRLTTLTDSLNQSFTYNYDVVNRLTSRAAPNGVTTNFTYDGLDRLFELSHTKSPATLSIHQYGYNNANNLASWLGSGGNRSFNYDNADRLIGVLKMGGNESYGYDAAGNRTSSHLSTSYSYQGFNKLASTTSATYTYDNNGRQLTKADGSGTRTLTWDHENRLKQVTLPGSPTVANKYDALGRRIQRTTNAGADERYVYDGPDVVADLNSSSAVTTTYFNGPGIDDHLRQTNPSTGVSYFLTDHLGTTTALTDASGNVVETLSYDSFGNNTGSARTRYTYTGRERDPDTGLLNYRARFYDPQLGRFISEDPIGFAGGDVNLYGYVWQNPLTHTDPSGLDGWGNDLADWLDPRIETARAFYEPDADAIDWNTGVNFGANVAHGFADMFRVGSAIGNVAYGPPDNGYGIAANILIDVTRATGIFVLVGGPAARLAVPASPGLPKVSAADCHCPTPTPGSPPTVYRVWGDGARPNGSYWTTTNPGTVPNFRARAGLPEQNSGRFVSEGVLIDECGVSYGRAAGGAGGPGGIPEVFVPDPARQVQLTRVSGVNRPF